MRDLDKYPITYDEIIHTLEWLKAIHHPNHTHVVGDPTPVILDKVIEIVKQHKEENVL